MAQPLRRLSVEEQLSIFGVASRPRKCIVSAINLANRWMIGLSTAQKTLAGTTQLSVRTGEGPIHHRFKKTLMAHRYKRLATTFYTDTLFEKENSSLDYEVAQVYTNAHCDFVYVVPLPSSESGDLTDSLYQFFEAVGVSDVLVTDDAPSLTGVHTCFVKACRQLHIQRRVCLPHDHRANRAEVTIR